MKQRQGFTLVELLVVLAIIGVLFTLIMPAIASTRERAHTATCMNNMKQLVTAALMYADEHGEAIPDVTALGDYIDDESVFICPRDSRPGLGASKPSYTAYKDTPASLLPSDLGGLQSERILYIESAKAGVEPKANITGDDIDYTRHDERSVLVFADGHVLPYNEGQAAQLMGMIVPEGRRQGP